MAPFRDETIHIVNLRVECVIGVYPEERFRPQPLIVNADLPRDFSAAARGDGLAETLDYSHVAEEIRDFLGRSRFQLLETLIRRLAEHLCQRFTLSRIHLHIRKPQAVPDSDGAAVSLTLSREEDGEP